MDISAYLLTEQVGATCSTNFLCCLVRTININIGMNVMYIFKYYYGKTCEFITTGE
jgi:hypothetical protein